MTLSVSAVTAVNVYLRMNLLLICAAAIFAGVRILNERLPRVFSYQQVRAVGWALAASAVVLPLLWSAHTAGGSVGPSAQVWSAPSMKSVTTIAESSPRIALSFAVRRVSLPLAGAASLATVLALFGSCMVGLRLLRDARATFRVLRRANVLRRIGRVRTLISEETRVPFACWLPRRAYIVLPAALLLEPEDLLMAVRHEAQHHRQGDTRLVYLLQTGRALFSLNPCAHWLLRQLQEVQEFACDEALTRRRSHQREAYCACLVRIAEAAATPHAAFGCCMASGAFRLLSKRVSAALYRPAQRLRAPIATVLGVSILAPLLAASLAIGAPIQDLRLSPSDAQALLATTSASGDFPLEMNAQILGELNLLLGTPDGRAYLRDSVRRMQDQKAIILEQIRAHALPTELLAVPILESGWRNLGAEHNVLGCAGLWQFMAETARRYGLEVSARQDQRLDIPAETDAAMRLLAQLHDTFGDWRLALLAYNAGETRVSEGIRATGSRDAWALTRAGFGYDRGYLARAMAIALILDNPKLLD